MRIPNKSRDLIYPAGSFFGWRDEFMDRLTDFDFKDPRQHRQHAIAKLVEDDMNSAQECPILLAYFPKEKSRGTMTYAEIGASRAKGNCIITIDENTQDPLFEKVASHTFNNKEQAFELLIKGQYKSKFLPIKPQPEEICKNVLFVGDTEQIRDVINKTRKIKNCHVGYDATQLNNFSKDVDVTVVNFEGQKRSREAIFYMGLSYALDIPVILSTKNPIVYPPLAGLARRLFTTEKKNDILKEYLTKLTSQNINSEAKIMYNLFDKFKS